MAGLSRRALVHVSRFQRLCLAARAANSTLLFCLVCFVFVLTACRPARGPQIVRLPPPSERGFLGTGDIFSLEIVGEKDLPKDYQVAADGTVDFPYIHAVHVAGLEAQELARLVRQRLIHAKVLSDPSVIVQVKEFHSRKVTLLGQVARSGSYPFTPGMTLIQAVSMAGGLTSIANSDRVNITRKADSGKVYTALLSVGAIMEGKSPDVPLQAGDQIYVYERIF